MVFSYFEWKMFFRFISCFMFIGNYPGAKLIIIWLSAIARISFLMISRNSYKFTCFQWFCLQSGGWFKHRIEWNFDWFVHASNCRMRKLWSSMDENKFQIVSKREMNIDFCCRTHLFWLLQIIPFVFHVIKFFFKWFSKTQNAFIN